MLQNQVFFFDELWTVLMKNNRSNPWLVQMDTKSCCVSLSHAQLSCSCRYPGPDINFPREKKKKRFMSILLATTMMIPSKTRTWSIVFCGNDIEIEFFSQWRWKERNVTMNEIIVWVCSYCVSSSPFRKSHTNLHVGIDEQNTTKPHFVVIRSFRSFFFFVHMEGKWFAPSDLSVLNVSIFVA